MVPIRKNSDKQKICLEKVHADNLACNEIAKKLLSEKKSIELNKLKIESCKKFGLMVLPKNSEILEQFNSIEKEEVREIIRIKNVRSISGINIVSVMSKPIECPHGRCSYCPHEAGVPNSYTGHEPAAMRGLQNFFDPFNQVSNRLAQLRDIGHIVNKVELIVQGGTFPATPIEYQTNFIHRCLDAITDSYSKDLEEAKKKAEESEVKNVGITVETRPDWAKERHVDLMLDMGVTRVELGVQTLNDNIYAVVNRGHSVNDVVKSFQVIKDAGLKIVAHMMPGLPGSDIDMDLETFKRLFSKQEFKPDMIKIYPCLVLKGTELYEWWLNGAYKPYTTEEAAELVTKIKEIVPPWIRIMRIQRDIPIGQIVDGVKRSNLRQIVQEKLKMKDSVCRCIRCREVGHKMLKDGISPDIEEISLETYEYKSSGGIEIFISFEDNINDILIGYLRLRVPSELAHRSEVANNNSSLIREIHVYGPLVPVGGYSLEGWQHRGYGKRLILEAERTSIERYDMDKILVTSALGVKKYFEKIGYRHDGPYMSKILS